MTEMVYRSAVPGPVEPILSRWWRTVDHMSIAAVVGLMAIGLMLSMASSPILAERKDLAQFHFVYRQAVFGTAAIVVMLIISTMSPRTVRRWAVLGFAIGFVSLILLPVLGTDLNKGATRWYSFGPLSLQPSEFVKPGFIAITAWLMSASFDRRGPPGITLSFLLMVIICLILALQPDFGQAALVAVTWGVMYFVAGAPMWLIVGLAALVLAAGWLAYATSDHFAGRIDGFLSTDIDPTTQLGHAASSFRQGGLFGVGPGEGEIKRTLPDAYTDFIIAVAAEEYGILMCFLVIALILTIVIRALWNLRRERDRFTSLAGTGLAAMFAFQALINLGVAVRLLPAKGMTLPFVSYGGSSLIASGIALGMLLAFSRQRPQEGLEDVFGSGQ